jgi:hypothetical protein
MRRPWRRTRLRMLFIDKTRSRRKKRLCMLFIMRVCCHQSTCALEEKSPSTSVAMHLPVAFSGRN